MTSTISKEILEKIKKARRVEVVPETSNNNVVVSIKGYNCNNYSYVPVREEFLHKYRSYIIEVEKTYHTYDGIFSTLVEFHMNIPLQFPIILAEGLDW